MANRQMTRPAGTELAGPAEQGAVMRLAIQPEAGVSDAPLFVPQAAALTLLLGLLLAAPKEPQEPKAPKKV
jgi:hypothetical protein